MDNPLKNLSTPEKAAVGIGGAVVLFLVWKQHQASAGSTSTSTDAIDPVTGLPVSQDNVTDPATGQTYLAEAQEYGSVAAADAALSGGGLNTLNATSGDGVGGYYDQTPASNSTLVPGTTYGTNGAWAQAVEAGLADIGYSQIDVAAALGRYLGGLTVTANQASIIGAALAEYGNPPVGSYTIKLAPAPKPTADVEVPDVDGVDVNQATGILKEAGFKVNGPAGVKGVTHVVTSTTPASGSHEPHGSTVTLHVKSVGGTAPGAKVSVPNVVGQEQSKAYAEITKAGLHPSGQAPVKGKIRTVTGQNPAAGAKIDKGGTVSLTTKLS